VVLCESAIDAKSYFALHSHSHCIALSTARATTNLPWLNNWMDRGYEIFCAFDADSTGELMAKKMIEAFPTVKRLRPLQHDWNEVLQQKAGGSVGKNNISGIL